MKRRSILSAVAGARLSAVAAPLQPPVLLTVSGLVGRVNNKKTGTFDFSEAQFLGLPQSTITTSTAWTPRSVFVGPTLLQVMREVGVRGGTLIFDPGRLFRAHPLGRPGALRRHPGAQPGRQTAERQALGALVDNLSARPVPGRAQGAHRRIEVHLASQPDRGQELSDAAPASGMRRNAQAPACSDSHLAHPPHLVPRASWPALLLLLLTAAVATLALVSQQLVPKASDSIPGEGAYWAVAQYQIAHHRLKQELRAIAAGEPVNAPELARRAQVLASRVSLLTEPSEAKARLGGVPGYTQAAQRVAALQRSIGPLLDKADFSQADATKVLEAFGQAHDDELLNQLANDVRRAEIDAKDAMLQSLARRIGWAWWGFALCWTALVLWLLYAIRSRRRYRTAAQERQQAVEDMEQALGAKRRFLSMVNHEVRSPLQSIVASAELLAMKELQPDSVAAIRRIRHAVTVLHGQLRDLLTIARGESAQLPSRAESFELGELVQDVCAGPKDAALAKGLHFELELPPASVVVSADPVRIAQVLRNLVENAVRYTSTGKVQVRVEPFIGHLASEAGSVNTPRPQGQVAPAAASPEGLIRFEVHDTGPGLPPGALQRLHSQAEPFMSGGDGSSGIGLFVIRDVLRQLGGKLDQRTRDAADPQGQGTTFTVSIPVKQVQDDQKDGGRVASREPLQVLVVDDLAEVRDSLSDITRGLGHSCRAAGSAAEALPLVAAQHFDVILIDLEMPATDGLALASQIRSGSGPNASSMLILISAAENQGVGRALPFDGFLQKPIDGQGLRRLIGAGPNS